MVTQQERRLTLLEKQTPPSQPWLESPVWALFHAYTPHFSSDQLRELRDMVRTSGRADLENSAADPTMAARVREIATAVKLTFQTWVAENGPSYPPTPAMIVAEATIRGPDPSVLKFSH